MWVWVCVCVFGRVCGFFFLPLLPDQAQAVTNGPVTAKPTFKFQATSYDTGMGFPMSTVVIIILLELRANSFPLTHTIQSRQLLATLNNTLQKM